MRVRRFFAAVIAAAIFTAPTAHAADGMIRAHANQDMKIALTFDDGPHPRYTTEILDILEKYHVKATFFVIGRNVRENPELVMREVSEGHEIGNHTMNHSYLDHAERTAVMQEITEAETAIAEICDLDISLFRPPGGRYSGYVRDVATETDYTVVLWNIDTRDWARAPVEEMSNMVLERAKSGDIILCHDYVVGESPTPAFLERILPELLDRGYEFVTVSELLDS